jgi:hypothetical protein
MWTTRSTFSFRREALSTRLVVYGLGAGSRGAHGRRASWIRRRPRLAKELLEQKATGDRAHADAWFNKYDKMPADLKAALAAPKDVPVDIDPDRFFSSA